VVITQEMTKDRNELILSIARDFGEKLGLEPLAQDACTDMLMGIRISELVMSFSEGLRDSIPLTGRVIDRDTMQQMQDVQGDEGEGV
jgi:hypothetical protein